MWLWPIKGTLVLNWIGLDSTSAILAKVKFESNTPVSYYSMQFLVYYIMEAFCSAKIQQ